MSKSDLALVVLNLATLVFAVIGLTAQHLDPMSAAAVVAMVTALANGGAVLRRSRAPERAREPAPVDEMDATRVLDLDARLEALERAHADSVDAARWRALVESGQVSGPGAPVDAGESGRAETRERV